MYYWIFILLLSDILSAGIGFFAAKVKWHAAYRRRLRRAVSSIHDGARALVSREDNVNIHDLMNFHYRRPGVRHSSLDDFRRLQACFDRDRPYLRHNITIADAAHMIGSNRSYISRAVQMHGKCSFPNFVNRYRVNYSLALMQKNPSLRVHDVAFMSGFNTTGSFTSAFRDVMGVTPGKWVKDYQYKMSLKE